MSTTLSSQLYSSRDNIRSQLVELMKTYLELENIPLVKGSFISFIVNSLSTLTSNLFFYESSVYNEFFLTKAKIFESVINHSASIGYNTVEASYSSATVLITIPLTFDSNDVSIIIPSSHRFYASTVQFVTYYETNISVINNSNVTISINDSGRIQNIPVDIDTTSNQEFSFVLNVRQTKTSEYEFKIDEDLQPYQFTDVEINLREKVSSITVKVKPPDSADYTLYTEFNSLFLMNSEDYGYVNRRTGYGRRIYFGNGLIGFQPLPGSTVLVTVVETNGEEGNVIAGTINSGDRLYTIDDSITKIVDYTVTNTSAASGGIDEESIEDIRNNAITNLTSLSRLVSENDFKNLNIVIPTSPIKHSFSVLKRSDLKINEIQLFTILEFNSEIVATRNTYITVPITTTSVEKLSIVTINNIEYYTLFDITIDSVYNNVANYNYTITDIRQIPTLVQTYNVDYDIKCSYLDIDREDSSITFELLYTCSEVDYSDTACTMTILSSNASYIMTNDSINKKFIYEFQSYESFPSGIQTLYFTIYSPSNQSVLRYSISISVRKSLSSFMMSNISKTSTDVTVYDVPVVKKSYYDSIDQRSFELNIMQNIVNSMDFKSSRMLTDFINLKFSNTTGSMLGMNYNTVTKLNVTDYNLKEIPSIVNTGDRYIVSGSEGGLWEGKENQIAQAIDETSWTFIDPVYNDIIYVNNKSEKLIYSGHKWVQMNFQIPLQIHLDVYKKSTYTESDISLETTIKSTIISSFSSRFGLNIELFMSEVIDVVQSVEGVYHCVLTNPPCDIFYNFDLDDFSESDLLIYTPEYVYFDNDSIFINIL